MLLYSDSDTCLFRLTYTYTTCICKLPFIRISLVTKINSAFDFSAAFILGHPVYFDYQDFPDFASDLHSKVLMQKSCEKCCD